MKITSCLRTLFFILYMTVVIFTLKILLADNNIQSIRRSKTNIIFNNKDLCSSLRSANNSRRTIAIVVLSARHHREKRNLIRQSYGSIRSANNIQILTVVFMLGNSGPDQIGQMELEQEIVEFGDIISGNFDDNYRNLTLKSIMAYEWLTSYCRQAQFVVKTDDDVMVNVYRLTEELSSWSQTDVSSSNIWCSVHNHEKTINNPVSKFYVPNDEFSGNIFPRHCAGVGYVTPMIVIDRIVNEISRSFPGRVCTHEDVFMTSIVPAKINSIWNRFQIPAYSPIQLVGKNDDWYSLHLETEKGDDAQFLIKLLQQPANELNNFDEFRKRFGTKVFYLLTKNKLFTERFLNLWDIVEKSFLQAKNSVEN